MTLCWGEGGVSFEEDVFIWKNIGQAQFNPAYRIFTREPTLSNFKRMVEGTVRANFVFYKHDLIMPSIST